MRILEFGRSAERLQPVIQNALRSVNVDMRVYVLDAFRDSCGKYLRIPIGEIKRDPLIGLMMFRYYRSCLELGPKMVLADPVNLPSRYKWFPLGRHGTSAIRDSAPDAWGRLVIDECMGPRNFHEIDYIAFPNPARIGNLDFGDSGSGKPVGMGELPALQRIFWKLEKNLVLMKKEKAYLEARFYGASIGGARPKCTVVDDNGTLWIVKMKSMRDDRPDAAIEAATLRPAAKCGINVCHAEIRSVDGHEALFTRRFDRRGDGSRTGFMSAHSALGVGLMDDEIANANLRDYRILASRIRQYGFKEDLPELFRRIAFNIIVRNVDDHEETTAFSLKTTVCACLQLMTSPLAAGLPIWDTLRSWP